MILIPFSFSSRLFLMKTFIVVGSWIFSYLLNFFQLMKQGLIQYMENFTFIKVLMLILRHEVIFQLKEQGRFIIIFNYGKETIYCYFYSWNRDDFIINSIMKMRRFIVILIHGKGFHNYFLSWNREVSILGKNLMEMRRLI